MLLPVPRPQTPPLSACSHPSPGTNHGKRRAGPGVGRPGAAALRTTAEILLDMRDMMLAMSEDAGRAHALADMFADFTEAP